MNTSRTLAALAAAAIATLTLTLSASAQAQSGPVPSSVTLYGSVDQYLNFMKSSSGRSLTTVNDGAMLRSRVGLRGSEDIGGGLATTFTLEHGLYADSGKQNDSTRFFDRQAWVGMASPWGEVRIGRQNTAAFYRSEYIDYSGRTLGSLSNHYGLPARYDNDLSYISPRFGGLQLEAHYAIGEQARGGPSSKAVWQFAADYLDGPWRVGYAGVHARPPADSPMGKTIVFDNLYLNYDHGNGRIYLSVIRSNNSTSSSVGLFGNNAGNILGATGALVAGTDVNARRYHNVVQLSADYRLSTTWRVGGMIGRIADTSGREQGADGASVGAFYSLSKRTTLYTFLQTLQNDKNAGFVMAGSAAVLPNFAAEDVNGKSIRALQMGIVHRF